MAIGPIMPIAIPTPPTVPTPTVTSPGAATAGDGAAGTRFESSIAGAIDNLAAQQQTTDTLATQAATGQLSDISQYLVASTESQLSTQLTVAVRNKAVEAFNDIMRMQV